MTDEEIRALGPELDALVAEKVMALTRVNIPRKSMTWGEPGAEERFTIPNGFPRQDSYALASRSGRWVYFVGHHNDICYQDGAEVPAPPHASEELGAAMGMVEALRARGFNVELTLNNDGRNWVSVTWSDDHGERREQCAHIGLFAGFRPCGCAVGGLPLEICRAALMALSELERWAEWWKVNFPPMKEGRSRANPWWGPRRVPVGAPKEEWPMYTLIPVPTGGAMPVETVGGFNIWTVCPWCYDEWPCRARCHLRVADPSKVVQGDGFLLVAPGASVVERKG